MQGYDTVKCVSNVAKTVQFPRRFFLKLSAIAVARQGLFPELARFAPVTDIFRESKRLLSLN